MSRFCISFYKKNSCTLWWFLWTTTCNISLRHVNMLDCFTSVQWLQISWCHVFVFHFILKKTCTLLWFLPRASENTSLETREYARLFHNHCLVAVGLSVSEVFKRNGLQLVVLSVVWLADPYRLGHSSNAMHSGLKWPATIIKRADTVSLRSLHAGRVVQGDCETVYAYAVTLGSAKSILWDKVHSRYIGFYQISRSYSCMIYVLVTDWINKFMILHWVNWLCVGAFTLKCSS